MLWADNNNGTRNKRINLHVAYHDNTADITYNQDDPKQHRIAIVASLDLDWCVCAVLWLVNIAGNDDSRQNKDQGVGNKLQFLPESESPTLITVIISSISSL